MSVGPYGVWGVNSNDDVYKKISGGWQHIPGKLSDISVGLNSVWGVSNNNQVFRRVKGANHWEQIHIEGGLKQVGEECVLRTVMLLFLSRFLLAKYLTRWCGGQIKMTKYLFGKEGTDGSRFQAISGLFPVERQAFGAST